MKFLCRKISLSTFSGFKLALFLVTMFPARLNILSLGTEDAGIAKYFLAKRLNLPLDYSISSGHMANQYARLYLDNIEYTKKAINSIHNVGNWRTINTNNVI
jgi:hypothetical protein